MSGENFEYEDKIEDMTDDELRRQQQQVCNRDMPSIRAVDYVYGAHEQVRYDCEEVTAVCPMTGLPDFYTLHIDYVPEEKVPELKSLKYYLLAYRDIPILHEHLAQKVYADFMEAVEPAELRLVLDVGVRGGIRATVTVEK